MALTDIDFEGAATKETYSEADNSNVNSNESNTTQDDTTDFNGGDTDDVTGKDGNSVDQNLSKNSSNDDTSELNQGDVIEFDGEQYTVDNNGNLVDKNGSIFKEAKDVKEWLKGVEVTDDNDGTLSLQNIQNAIGVTITDEEGNPVEFTNDANGVSAYIDSVINIRSQELQQAAVNRLYADNPLLKQFQDYVQLTGSPKGFGELPDRSGIVLDKDNEHQLIAVIQMAAQEFGNKMINDNYIKYLRSSGGLYEEAQNQLNALVEKDTMVRRDIETRAAQQRAEEAEAVNEYWSKVNNVINSRVIGGYKIPESFTKEVNGQKIVLTPKDFFDYIAVAREAEDGSRMTSYQRDLGNLTDEEYMNREMLDAWLLFTGGTYKDLIDMAVKEDKVRQLRIKSKEHRSSKPVRVVRKQNGKASIDDIIL